jgi:hypothetical protein
MVMPSEASSEALLGVRIGVTLTLVLAPVQGEKFQKERLVCRYGTREYYSTLTIITGDTTCGTS